jgi:hypothetical protein
MWFFTALSAVPAIGGVIVALFRAYFWMRTIRAPKNKPEVPDDTPRSTQEVILRFSADKRTRGSSFLTQGFNHVTAYIYVEDSQEKVGKHEWVRVQRVGPCLRVAVVRQQDRDLASVLGAVEGVKVIKTKVRLPVSRPWRPRFAFSPGGAGVVKTHLNLFDAWVWTPYDIWEVEREAKATRNRRRDALRNGKLMRLGGLFLVSWLAQWLAFEEPIIAIALMIAAPALALLLNHVWRQGIPNFGRVLQEEEEEGAVG